MKLIRKFPLSVRATVSRENYVNSSMSKMMVSLVLVFCSAVFSRPQQPLYLDSSKSIQQRIDDLLPRMTLEEKIGQMNMPCSYLSALGRSHEEKVEFAKRFTEGTLREDLGPGGGFFTLANHVLDIRNQTTGGLLQYPPGNCNPEDSPENTSSADGGRDTWVDVR
ncbi:hypothetical protein ACFL5Z_06150 [Planctomycetota bacterium]